MPPATSADALSQMTQAQSQMQDPSAIMQGEQKNLGVPQAQQQVSGLRQAIANTTNLLNNVTPSIEGRTANSLVTSAQANRQIQNESAPIAKTLSDQTGKEAQSEGDLKDLMTQAGNNAQLKIQGQNEKLGFLKNVYDALFNKEQAAADSKMKQDQFNASQSLEQQKLAEQQRESNQSNSLEQQKLQSGTMSDAAKAQADLLSKFTVKQHNTGDYAFKDNNGVPISMSQYAQAKSLGSGDILNMLANGSAYDRNVYSKVHSLSGDRLASALNAYKVYGRF